jgi:hypothetical protein
MVNVDSINIAPMMISFSVREGVSNMWFFEGEVLDEDVSSVTIRFGGLLAGETAAVNADGTFSFGKLLPDGTQGAVSAKAVDELGLESANHWDEVYQY